MKILVSKIEGTSEEIAKFLADLRSKERRVTIPVTESRPAIIPTPFPEAPQGIVHHKFEDIDYKALARTMLAQGVDPRRKRGKRGTPTIRSVLKGLGINYAGITVRKARRAMLALLRKGEVVALPPRRKGPPFKHDYKLIAQKLLAMGIDPRLKRQPEGHSIGVALKLLGVNDAGQTVTRIRNEMMLISGMGSQVPQPSIQPRKRSPWARWNYPELAAKMLQMGVDPRREHRSGISKAAKELGLRGHEFGKLRKEMMKLLRKEISYETQKARKTGRQMARKAQAEAFAKEFIEKGLDPTNSVVRADFLRKKGVWHTGRAVTPFLDALKSYQGEKLRAEVPIKTRIEVVQAPVSGPTGRGTPVSEAYPENAGIGVRALKTLEDGQTHSAIEIASMLGAKGPNPARSVILGVSKTLLRRNLATSTTTRDPSGDLLRAYRITPAGLEELRKLGVPKLFEKPRKQTVRLDYQDLAKTWLSLPDPKPPLRKLLTDAYRAGGSKTNPTPESVDRLKSIVGDLLLAAATKIGAVTDPQTQQVSQQSPESISTDGSIAK